LLAVFVIVFAVILWVINKNTKQGSQNQNNNMASQKKEETKIYTPEEIDKAVEETNKDNKIPAGQKIYTPGEIDAAITKQNK